MTFAEAVICLRAAGVATPERDAQKLQALAGPDQTAFAALIARRAKREPISQILGTRAFWNAEFEVSSDVLDPRPDTETLIEAALGEPWQTVLDLGTGSGCILLSLLAERGGSRGTGSDISAAALQVARRNCLKLGLVDRAQLQLSDWFVQIEGAFDLIVSNPPYISAQSYQTLDPELRLFEPKLALTPGGDGLDPYRVITACAPDHLTPGGALIVEIGFDQSAAVSGLFQAAGFKNIEVMRDLGGKERVIRGNIA